MSISKKIARSIIFPSITLLGMDKLIRSVSDNDYLNIMYHGVVDDDSTYFSPRNINSKQFEQHLKYYKKSFDIISLSEAFYRVQNNIKPKRKTITISFDDGFKNNLDTALPLLEKYEIPTSFFISSIILENKDVTSLWSELIATLSYFYSGKPIFLENDKFIDLYNKEKKITLTNMLKICDFAERDRLLEILEQKYNLNKKIKELPEEVWKLMNEDELIQLSKSSFVEIGSHGHLHYNLGEIGIPKAKEELQKSKLLLEKAIGKEVTLVAYPDGSYNNQVKDIAEELGYVGQLAVNYQSSLDISDKRIMNRHGIATTTTYDSNIIFLNKAFKKKGIKI